MEFIRFLEGVRTPFFDKIFSVVTYFGDELLMISALLLIVWCSDKKSGYFALTAGMFSLSANQILKVIFKIPRPWVRDPKFTIVESAREAASGYSFPSGHTANAVSVYGSAAVIVKSKWLKSVLIILIGLIAFSRMYLGVHTIWDVLTSVALSTIILFAFKRISDKAQDNNIVLAVLSSIMLIAAVTVVLIAESRKNSFVTEEEKKVLLDSVKNAYVILGATFALVISRYIDKFKLNYPTKAVWWAQILKCVIGFAIVLGIKSVLKAPLNSLFGENLASLIRYFIIAFFGGTIWPMTFKFWSRLGKAKN